MLILLITVDFKMETISFELSRFYLRNWTNENENENETKEVLSSQFLIKFDVGQDEIDKF